MFAKALAQDDMLAARSLFVNKARAAGVKV